METWDFAHCLPYFKRMENALDSPHDDIRGQDGPIKLTRGPATNPLFNAFFEAAKEAGHHRTDDVNSYQQEGIGPFDRHIVNGQRLSTSHAYLLPNMHPVNFHVETRAFVKIINFECTRAKGVNFKKGKKEYIIDAGVVVLAGGAFNAPQLLQLSGVGDAEHLRSLDIEPVVDLPGVG